MGLIDGFLSVLTALFDFPLAEKAKINRLVDASERAIEGAFEESAMRDLNNRLGSRFYGRAEFHVYGVMPRPTLADCSDEESRAKFGLKLAKSFQDFNASCGLHTLGDSSLDVSDLIARGEMFCQKERKKKDLSGMMVWNSEKRGYEFKFPD